MAELYVSKIIKHLSNPLKILHNGSRINSSSVQQPLLIFDFQRFFAFIAHTYVLEQLFMLFEEKVYRNWKTVIFISFFYWVKLE
jgi:hypothetical protein